MSEILGRKSCRLDEGVGRRVQFGEEGPQPWRRLSDEPSVQRLKTGAEHARVDLREEQRDASTEWRDGVTEPARDAAEQSLAGQASQIVAHLARGVGVVGEQLGDHGAQAPVGDPFRGARKPAEGAQERHRARLAELQGGRRAPLRGLGGQHEIGKLGPGQATVMGGLLRFQQARVDVLAQRAEVAEITQPLPTPKSWVSLKVVSVRRARSSLKYCLMWQCLYSTWTLGATPWVTTRV